MKRVLKIVDADHWLKYAAVREDERLSLSFSNYEKTLLFNKGATEQTKKEVLELLKDFLHLNYNMTLRDDIEQFCSDYEKSDQTNIIITGNDAIVEIDGIKGNSFNLDVYKELAEMAE